MNVSNITGPVKSSFQIPSVEFLDGRFSRSISFAAARILIGFCRVVASSRSCCERLPLNTGCFLFAAFHLNFCMLHQHGSWRGVRVPKGLVKRICITLPSKTRLLSGLGGPVHGLDDRIECRSSSSHLITFHQSFKSSWFKKIFLKLGYSIYRQPGTNPNHCHICAPSSKWWMLKSLHQYVRWAWSRVNPGDFAYISYIYIYLYIVIYVKTTRW